MALQLYRPFFKRKDLEAALATIALDAVGSGKEVQSLIQELHAHMEFSFGVALREPERAIKIALESLKLKPQSRIALSPLAPARYHRAITELGHQPIYIDNERLGLNFGVLNTQKVDLVLLFHHLGERLTPPLQIGSQFIEDFSDALFCKPYAETALAILSIEPEALLPGAGGSLILSKVKNTFQELEIALSAYDRSILLSDLSASLARMQLLELKNSMASRIELSDIFAKALEGGRHLSFYNPEKPVPFGAFPVLIESGIQEVLAYIEKRGITVGLGFKESALYHGLVPNASEDFPHAVSIMRRTLLFPLHAFVGKKESQEIVKILSTLP